jgi:hypothetical protein
MIISLNTQKPILSKNGNSKPCVGWVSDSVTQHYQGLCWVRLRRCYAVRSSTQPTSYFLFV